MARAAESVALLEKAIGSQRQLQRLQFALALAIVGLGILCVALTQWFSGSVVPETAKQLGSLGGGFIATLSTFPLKQLYDRRFKIAALEYLLAGWRRAAAGDVSAEEQAGLQQRFDKILDAGLTA
jgi:hypothetical protein